VENLTLLIRRWYDDGDRQAAAALVDRLPHKLPRACLAMVGDDLARDVVQTVLVRLLDRRKRLLDGIDNPAAYAQRALQRAAVDVLRKRREAISMDQMEEPERDALMAGTAEQAPDEPWGVLDVDRALAVAASLGTDQRLAVFLHCSPGAMTDSDWQEVRQRHALEPVRPREPQDPDGASRLLWPPDEPESKEDRRRRLERFRKVFERACQEIRRRWGA
jgi:DNA-directed RNA polymerase specialized sigma24 family protein